MNASSTAPTVVIVDDSPPVVDALALTLEAEGFAVAAYGSGTEFLAALAALAGPLCVLLDVGLPVLNGYEVLAALGGAACRFPVILITGLVDESFSAQASAAGASGWIRKPFDADRVLEAIRGALEHVRRIPTDLGSPQRPTD
jgi:FixJ family two-component response regulator